MVLPSGSVVAIVRPRASSSCCRGGRRLAAAGEDLGQGHRLRLAHRVELVGGLVAGRVGLGRQALGGVVGEARLPVERVGDGEDIASRVVVGGRGERLGRARIVAPELLGPGSGAAQQVVAGAGLGEQHPARAEPAALRGVSAVVVELLHAVAERVFRRREPAEAVVLPRPVVTPAVSPRQEPAVRRRRRSSRSSPRRCPRRGCGWRPGCGRRRPSW